MLFYKTQKSVFYSLWRFPSFLFSLPSRVHSNSWAVRVGTWRARGYILPPRPPLPISFPCPHACLSCLPRPRHHWPGLVRKGCAEGDGIEARWSCAGERCEDRCAKVGLTVMQLLVTILWLLWCLPEQTTDIQPTFFTLHSPRIVQ